MAITCLIKTNKEALLKAFKSGELTIKKLYSQSEEQNRKDFAKYVGEESASFVNAKFEQAKLSKQKKAFANFILRNTTSSDPIRKDMISKVERVKKFLKPSEEYGFMEDLAEMKLGMKVSEEEAKFLLDAKEKIDELKEKIPENSSDGSEERMAYGYALDAFKEFVAERKSGAMSLKISERFKPANFGRNLMDLAGITKSLVATLDNSFIGRQGWKTLLDGKYKVWGQTALKTFQVIGNTLFRKGNGWFKSAGDAQMRAIRAYIYSSQNALNGKYNAAKNGYGLGVLREETFPVALPDKIPILGRVFGAAESAFNGGALFMRKKLADAVIANAEKSGVDMLDPVQATPRARRVSAMTGRGDIGRLDVFGKEINALMFSVKFLKSNFDTLTAHQFEKGLTPQMRREAALSTLRIASSATAMLAVASMLGLDVEWDPRSSKSGQICRGNNCFDITGGMRGLITLGARIVPTLHNGEWGFWTKSGSTGKYTNTYAGEYGKDTALDTIENFFEGKLSPFAGMIRDIWKGEKFGGEKPTIVNSTIGLITPISVQTLVEELEKGNDELLLVMIAEAIGISPTKFSFSGQGKKWQELKEKKGEKIFNESLKIVQDRFNERAEKLKSSSKWKKMTNEEQGKELDKIKSEETNRIFKKYNIE